ncbi:MAG: Hpt domain-containing protein [Kiritimatiellae bacterium]|nr:Hpt domain-containing protein [Kiritimatiellia bacterium]
MTQSETPDGADRIPVRIPPKLQRLADKFLTNRQDDIRKMLECLKTGDYETIRILGHSMKGVGRGYGFEGITRLGAALEQAALQATSGTITDLITELKDYLRRVEVIPDENQSV